MFIRDLFSQELKNLLEGEPSPFRKNQELPPDLAEAILTPEVLAQVKKIQQSAASPEEKQRQIDAVIAQHSTRHRHATNPITRTPSSAFATKTDEEKVRLDPKCWHNKKIGNPKTKIKGGVRVNNCVPKESVDEQGVAGGSDNLTYIGNCTDDDVIEHIFGDATNFAQAVEEHGDEFTIDDLVVKYDPESDVHSFYYKKKGVAGGLSEMDNRTPRGDRREQRANSPEERNRREKELQDLLKKTPLELRKKLGLPEPKEQGVAKAETASPSGQPRIRKYSKIRADGSKAERYEVLDYQGRRVAGQGTEGFDDLENAKSFFKRNYSRLINPVSEEALSKKEKRKEKSVPDRPDRKMLESKKKYWCTVDKRWKDIKDGEQEKE